MYSRIVGTGSHLPARVLTNADLEKMVDTTDEWIRTRTGIRERRVCEDGASAHMGAKALDAALKNRGMDPKELELIIVATVTPDMFFPSTACLVQEKVGAKNAWGFDLNAACSGFLFALATGAQFIESGQYTRVAIVGSDKMTSITDYTDRSEGRASREGRKKTLEVRFDSGPRSGPAHLVGRLRRPSKRTDRLGVIGVIATAIIPVTPRDSP